MMMKIVNAIILLGLMLTSSVAAKEKKVDTEVKQLSGISIIGNKEAPKSLYIVPWRDSEVGVATSLSSGLLDENNKTIDKDVFIRELEFFELTHKNINR